MTEIRKLLRLNPKTFAVTIPKQYAAALSLSINDYVEVLLIDPETIGIRKLGKPRKGMTDYEAQSVNLTN